MTASLAVQGFLDTPNAMPLTTTAALFSPCSMQLNEHESKILFAESAIPVPPGLLVRPENLSTLAPSDETPPPWMLKVQILAGGRGKQGGVVTVASQDELVETGKRLFALRFNGSSPPFLRLESRLSIVREFYLSLAVQREWAAAVFTVGRQGGVDVESAGAADPHNLLIQKIDALAGMGAHHVRTAFFHLELDSSLWPGFRELVQNLWRCFTSNGLLLAEINPLVLTREQQWLALDGKVEVDDNHVELHPELKRLEQAEYFTPQELRARAAGLSYHRFNGRVGLMVNGAGLAMASMDLLNFSGLEPANFLDLGGGAGQQAMDTAMDILLGDEQVEAVLINLFGGILPCDKVAVSLIAALGGRPPAKPLVVRLSGHGAQAGRMLLANLSSPALHVTNNLNQALDILQGIVRPSPVSSSVFDRLESGSPSGTLHKTSVGSKARAFPLNRKSCVLVQGLTGREGQRHAKLMLEYGVRVVAGVTPFKGGQEVLGLPVYSSVAQAVRRHQIDASILFVPAAVAPDAILEAAQAEVPWIVCITEGIPQMEMLRVLRGLQVSKSRLIGPNTPGLIVPGEIKIGIMPGHIFAPGPVAVLSRSGTLTYETVHRLKAVGIGQSVCIGVGGDPYVGSGLKECGELVAVDPRTKALMILGEIGGQAEEEAAEHLRNIGWDGPILAFIVGLTAPEGKRLGHAGAILEKGKGGVKEKLERLRAAGVIICEDLNSIARLTARELQGRLNAG